MNAQDIRLVNDVRKAHGCTVAQAFLIIRTVRAIRNMRNEGDTWSEVAEQTGLKPVVAAQIAKNGTVSW